MNTTLALAVLFVWVLMMWRIRELEGKVEDLREEVRNGTRPTDEDEQEALETQPPVRNA